jgi:hypothetical protein
MHEAAHTPLHQLAAPAYVPPAFALLARTEEEPRKARFDQQGPHLDQPSAGCEVMHAAVVHAGRLLYLSHRLRAPPACLWLLGLALLYWLYLTLVVADSDSIVAGAFIQPADIKRCPPIQASTAAAGHAFNHHGART